MNKAEAKCCEEKESWRSINPEDVELGAEIGGGGVAVVYKGRFRGEKVAIKVLFDPKTNEKSYMEELLVMSELKHPNVVTFLGAIQYASDIAHGLAYLHGKAITHRDIKSNNILQASNGILKICDFGLVRTRNTTAGTPAYMAPELLQDRPFSHKVDIYAFGILLAELFSGIIPFREYDYQDIQSCVTKGERPQMPRYDTPESIKCLITQCWATKPCDRPEFSPQIKQCLDTALRSTSTTTKHSFCDQLDAKQGGGGDILDSLLGGF